MWRTAVSGHSEQKCSEAARLYLEGRTHHNWWVGSAKRISAAALRSPTRNYVAPSGGAVLVDGGWSPAGSAKDELGLRTGRNCEACEHLARSHRRRADRVPEQAPDWERRSRHVRRRTVAGRPSLPRAGQLVATPTSATVTRNLYRTFYGDTVANIANWLDTRR
jgi:hypothetical protein